MAKKTNLNILGATLQKASEQKKEIPNVQPAAPQPVHFGRKKRLATKRENAITVYCTDEMMEALTEIKYNNRVERQRVIQAALFEFLQTHYSESSNALDQAGFDKVREFEKSINIE